MLLSIPPNERLQTLIDLARRTPWFADALRAVRALDLPEACIGAGAVRNLVWDALHGYAQPSALADVDVAWFDAGDLDPARDRAAQRQLEAALPGRVWEVTNQAGVHLWFEACFGHAVEPLHSLEEAVASWPEYATCVALRLDADDRIHVIAPLGLDDLFEGRVRRNPRRVSLATYAQRIASKRYTERWPGVRIIPAEPATGWGVAAPAAAAGCADRPARPA